jgi:hypothetical protein
MAIVLLVEPFTRMLNMQVLWLQFAGAALLWWEANAAARIDMVVEEMRNYPPPPPATRAERILFRVGMVSSYVPLALGITAVAALVGAATAPQGWRALLLAEARVVAFAVAVIGFTLWTGRLLEKQAIKVARRIREAEAEGRMEQREIARRALRTIGFALVALATFLQMALVWAA